MKRKLNRLLPVDGAKETLDELGELLGEDLPGDTPSDSITRVRTAIFVLLTKLNLRTEANALPGVISLLAYDLLDLYYDYICLLNGRGDIDDDRRSSLADRVQRMQADLLERLPEEFSPRALFVHSLFFKEQD